jgi:hypothetical protein
MGKPPLVSKIPKDKNKKGDFLGFVHWRLKK